MSTFDDFQNLLRSAQNDLRTEMTADELRELLDAEITKPAEEMDTTLVEEILSLLYADEPSETEQQAGWDAIIRRAEAERAKAKRKRVLLRGIVAAAALALILFVVAGRDIASASRWSFLLKWLQPLAETFDIHTEVDHPKLTAVMKDTELIETPVSCYELYHDLADMPVEYMGYPTLPKWVPERFEFDHGSVFNDVDMYKANALYRVDQDWMSFIMAIYRRETQSLDYEYEKTATSSETLLVHGFEVTIYRNSDNNTASASWIVRDAHYTLTGSLTNEELETVIQGM